MSLSKQHTPDNKGSECDLGFNGKSLLSKSDSALFVNVSDDNIPLMKVENQICKSSTPKCMKRGFILNQNTDNELISEVNIVKRGATFKTASPSVIRKGLCMVRNESKYVKVWYKLFQMYIFSFENQEKDGCLEQCQKRPSM